MRHVAEILPSQGGADGLADRGGCGVLAGYRSIDPCAAAGDVEQLQRDRAAAGRGADAIGQTATLDGEHVRMVTGPAEIEPDEVGLGGGGGEVLAGHAGATVGRVVEQADQREIRTGGGPGDTGGVGDAGSAAFNYAGQGCAAIPVGRVVFDHRRTAELDIGSGG